MSNITVTVELCAEDRARLDNILESLKHPHIRPATKHGDVFVEEHEQMAQMAQKAAEAAEAAEAPEPEAPKDESPAPAEPEQPAPSVEELRALVQTLVANGHRDAVKAIVQQYAPKVSAVPEDKRAECVEKLLTLKEEKA